MLLSDGTDAKAFVVLGSSLPTANIGGFPTLDNEGFHDKQLIETFVGISCWRVHCAKFITSGASYILIMPSAEHVTRSRPKCLGPNLTSVTEVLESTRFDRFSHVRKLFSEPVAVVSPTSSQIAAVLSKEQVAMTCPNSGWAHVTFQTEP